MLAMLEFWDFVWIAVIVATFAGGSAAYSRANASDAARLRRVEAKIDLILKHLGLNYKDPTPWQDRQQRRPGSIVFPDVEPNETDEESSSHEPDR